MKLIAQNTFIIMHSIWAMHNVSELLNTYAQCTANSVLYVDLLHNICAPIYHNTQKSSFSVCSTVHRTLCN